MFYFEFFIYELRLTCCILVHKVSPNIPYHSCARTRLAIKYTYRYCTVRSVFNYTSVNVRLSSRRLAAVKFCLILIFISASYTDSLVDGLWHINKYVRHGVSVALCGSGIFRQVCLFVLFLVPNDLNHGKIFWFLEGYFVCQFASCLLK